MFNIFNSVLVEQFNYYLVKVSGKKKKVQAVWLDKGQMMFQTSDGLSKLLSEKDLTIIKEIDGDVFWKV